MRIATSSRRRLAALAGAVVVGALVGAVVASGVGADEPLRIVATVSVPLGRNPPTTVTIEPDGTARMLQRGRRPGDPDVDVEFPLLPPEIEEARSAVAASRFFEAWGPEVPATDQPTWDVEVRLGAQELRRAELRPHREFEPLEAFLWRFVRQADLTVELRRGEWQSVRAVLAHGGDRGIPRPAALAADIVACAAAVEVPGRCADAAALLVALASAEDFASSARDLLARLDGDRRGAVLARWAADLRAPERAAHRAAFSTTALAEVEATWSSWPTMTPARRAEFGALLAMLLRDGTAAAFSVAERMARSMGTLEKPLVPPGLLGVGAAAVPVVLRLLEDEAPGARASGAEMAGIQAGVVRGTTGLSPPLASAERAALESLFRDEVVSALERRAQDAAESFTVRRTCLEALDRWDGRVRAAEARAREEESEARKRADAEREAARPPLNVVGTLSIEGRLLGPADVPLPGFGVWAARPDGRCLGHAVTGDDGSFRVERLVEGEYDLLDTRPGEGFGGVRRGGPRLRTAVAAGTGDLVLRLPGEMIRGHVLDVSGAPAVGRRIVAQMRDAPSEQGPAYGAALADTDAQGRFWLLRLLPGTYDLEVVGHGPLRGGTAVEAGPGERTVEMLAGESITGRVVDETGAPLADASVSAAPTDATWKTAAATRTQGDGAFRLDRLDPSRRYRVWACVLGGGQRNALVEAVATGPPDVALRIDTTPHLRFRVDFRGRDPGWQHPIRIRRIAGGPPTERTLSGPVVFWRVALEGTWAVAAMVRDVDARGIVTWTWADLGTATTGEPEKAFEVPR